MVLHNLDLLFNQKNLAFSKNSGNQHLSRHRRVFEITKFIRPNSLLQAFSSCLQFIFNSNNHTDSVLRSSTFQLGSCSEALEARDFNFDSLRKASNGKNGKPLKQCASIRVILEDISQAEIISPKLSSFENRQFQIDWTCGYGESPLVVQPWLPSKASMGLRFQLGKHLKARKH